MAGLDPLDIELGARAALLLAEACTSLGLRCVDVPIVTTGLLEAVGAGQYKVRRFWAHAKRSNGATIVLYKYRKTTFRVRLEHREGPLYEVNWEGVRVPLDPEEVSEVRRRGLEVEFAPKSHMLFLYLEGLHEDKLVLSIGAPRLLLLLYQSPETRKLVEQLVDCVVNAAWGRIDCMESVALRLVRAWTPLGIVLPRVPLSLEDLFKVSPLFRRLFARGRGTRSQPTE